MKTNQLALFLFVVSLIVFGCKDDERFEGKLQLNFNPVPDNVWIYSVDNSQYPMYTFTQQDFKLHGTQRLLEIELNAGNYIVECTGSISKPATGVQVRPDKKTSVTYNLANNVWDVKY